MLTSACDSAGITIQSLPELAADPDRSRTLYDLEREIRQDMPNLDPPMRPPFEQVVEQPG